MKEMILAISEQLREDKISTEEAKQKLLSVFKNEELTSNIPKDKRFQNTLSLKFGGLKSYYFENPAHEPLVLELEELELQNPTSYLLPRQKEIVCELIDLCDEDAVYIWIENKYTTKEKAKEYIMNYPPSVVSK